MQCHAQFSGPYLVACVVFALHVKSTRYNTQNGVSHSDGLMKAMMYALRLLPEQIRKLASRIFESGHVPSQPILSRALLYVDVALMHWMAERHEALALLDAILFLLSDSSPQGGRNYQISEYYAIASNAIKVGELAIELKSLPRNPEEVTHNEIDTMHATIADIRANLSHHIFPPQCMDSKRSGLPYKGHCVIQQFRLESSSWGGAQSLGNMSFSWCCDMGPEALFNKIYIPDLTTFPHWRPPPREDLDGVAELNENYVAGDADPAFDISHVLPVTGMFHTLEAISKRLLEQLPVWRDSKKKIESMIITFHRPYTRRRFKKRCLVTPALQQESVHFNKGPPLMEGGRVWGVVNEATAWLDMRGPVIREAWDYRAMGEDVDANDLDDEGEAANQYKDTSAHLQRADEGIRDMVIWAVISLVQLFVGWMAAMEHWCEACPCHSRRFREFWELHVDELRCPLRGCRAVDLAVGNFKPFCEAVGDTKYNELVHLLAGLEEEQKATIIDNFNFGKNFIYVELDLRLVGWSGIPLRFMGVGHENMEIVIDTFIVCLAQFEALDPNDGISNLTLRVFSRGSRIRSQILAFLNDGVPWSEVPDLARYRTAAIFMPTVERTIERKHAQVSAGIRSAPHHSPVFTSVQGLRKPEILRVLDSNVDDAAHFCKLVTEKTRSARACIKSLGLEAHPEIRAHVDADTGAVTNTLPHNVAVDVIYRNDTTTIFQDLPDFPEPPPPSLPRPPSAQHEQSASPAGERDDGDDDDDQVDGDTRAHGSDDVANSGDQPGMFEEDGSRIMYSPSTPSATSRKDYDEVRSEFAHSVEAPMTADAADEPPKLTPTDSGDGEVRPQPAHESSPAQAVPPAVNPLGVPFEMMDFSFAECPDSPQPVASPTPTLDEEPVAMPPLPPPHPNPDEEPVAPAAPTPLLDDMAPATPRPLDLCVWIDDAVAECRAVERGGDSLPCEVGVAVLADRPISMLAHLQQKYGVEHFKLHASVADVFAVKREHSDFAFRTMTAARNMKTRITDMLAEELRNAPDSIMDRVLALQHPAPSGESDVGAAFNHGRQTVLDFPYNYFKIVEKSPGAITSHRSDLKLKLQPGELIVTRLTMLFGDHFAKDVFVWSELEDRKQDIQLLMPEDSLTAHLIGWERDTRKYYYSTMVNVRPALCRLALDVIKLLVEMDAREGNGISFDMTADDRNTYGDVLMELQQQHFVKCIGQTDIVESWVIAEDAFDTIEPVERVYKPTAVVKARLDTPLNQMSVLDLAGLLASRGFRHMTWLPSGDRADPKHLDVETEEPKLWFTWKPPEQHPPISKFYLMVLASLSHLKTDAVHHFQSDEYYKGLLGKQPLEKKRKLDNAFVCADQGIDLDELSLPPPRVRARRRVQPLDDEGPGRGRKRVDTTSKVADPRTHYWGAVLFSYYKKKNRDAQIIQCTCHRSFTLYLYFILQISIIHNVLKCIFVLNYI